MKSQYILLYFFFLCNIAFAQNDTYYYFKENKITLSKKLSKLSITAKRTIQKSDLSAYSFKPFTIPSNELDTNDIYFEVELNNTPGIAEYNQIVNSLNQNPKVIKANPFFGDNESDVGITNYFYVKLKNKNDLTKLQTKAMEFQSKIVEQNKFIPLWYTLVISKNTPYNTLAIANFFKECKLFDAAQPDFAVKIEANCTNDPLISSQWAFSNPISPSVSMNVCNAWQFSKGEGINIALVDNGIDIAHQDLAANMHPLSYDCMTGTSPAVFYGIHGTNMAGIIGAVENNNIDMAGIAPKCKIINVSTLLSNTTAHPNLSATRINRANGINWAWMNGADVINCSWSWNPNDPIFQPMYESIELALKNGRNGRGTVVVFASGNDNRNKISSPSNYLPDILVVGAINQTGMRWFVSSGMGSNYGTELDVVAPGDNLQTLYPSNNTGPTSATSPAAAHASGLAALIIGTDPDMSAGEVNDVIEKTARKLSGYNYNNNRQNGIWNNEIGYGLINAANAVASVYCADTKLHNLTFNGTQSFSDCKILSNNSIVRTGKTTYTVTKKALLNNNFEVKSDAQFEIKTW